MVSKKTLFYILILKFLYKIVTVKTENRNLNLTNNQCFNNPCQVQ
jgi:hypothetical protein